MTCFPQERERKVHLSLALPLQIPIISRKQTQLLISVSHRFSCMWLSAVDLETPREATVLTVFLPSAGRDSQVEHTPGLISLTVQAKRKDCGVNSFYKWTHSSLFFSVLTAWLL